MEEKHPSSLISRIAPTPSGFLHKGNAFSFVLTWLLIRKMGGRLLLRIDDSDTSRTRPEFIEDVFYTLDWLGLDYDSGPEGPQDFATKYSQQHRLPMYASLLDELRSLPGMVYACNCSRKEIRQQSQSGLYPGICRSRSLPYNKNNVAWRMRVPENEEVNYYEWATGSVKSSTVGGRMGDFVIRRKDGLPAYQLVSLADDIFYNVNFIVRGIDLRDSTAAQIYLANCLSRKEGKWGSGAKSFLKTDFFHHPLIRDNAGEKLSKSKGAASVHMMRAAGKKPQDIYRAVAGFCGLPDECAHTLSDLLSAFSGKALRQRSGA